MQEEKPFTREIIPSLYYFGRDYITEVINQ